MPKNKTNIMSLCCATAAVVGAFALVVASPAAHASPAVWNWTGTDCNVASPATPNCKWSDANNWDAGVPTTGVDVVFDQGAMQPAQVSATLPDNDISNLSLGTITLESGKSNLVSPLGIQGNAITLTGGIVADESISSSIKMNITLGADITVSGTDTGTDGSLLWGNVNGSDTIALAGHTLTFTHSNVNIDSVITGAGSVVYNHAGGYFTLANTNTYSGSTIALAGMVDGPAGMFGTSTLLVDNNATVSYEDLTTGTISTLITIQGVNSGSQVTSLMFHTSTSGGVTVALQHVTLQGATRFGNMGLNDTQSGLTINLSGITANSHCVEYLGGDTSVTDGPANGFTNGPTGCILTNAKTPDTAVSKFISANPYLVIVLGAITAGAVLMVARRQMSSKK